MPTAVKLIIIVWLIGGVQAAMADEAGDAVQVLSNLWKGTFDNSQKGHITTEFVGDAKSFKMRWTAYQPDGTVAVLDGTAPFRFLEIAGDSLSNLVVSCVPESECIFVRCLYKRAHDPGQMAHSPLAAGAGLGLPPLVYHLERRLALPEACAAYSAACIALALA